MERMLCRGHKNGWPEESLFDPILHSEKYCNIPTTSLLMKEPWGERKMYSLLSHHLFPDLNGGVKFDQMAML